MGHIKIKAKKVKIGARPGLVKVKCAARPRLVRMEKKGRRPAVLGLRLELGGQAGLANGAHAVGEARAGRGLVLRVHEEHSRHCVSDVAP